MNLLRSLLLVLLLLLHVIKAEASCVKFEYDIIGLVGVHSHIDMPFKIPLDLKKTPAKINRVALYLEGKSSPGSAISTKDGQQIELPVQFDIAIAEHFTQSFDLRTPIASFAALPSNFRTQVIFKPRPRNYSADWTFFTKGTGELEFSWGRGCPVSCRFMEHSTVDITKAVLIIEGDGLCIENDKNADRSQIEPDEYGVYEAILHEGDRIFAETEALVFPDDLKALIDTVQSESIVRDYEKKNNDKYLLNDKLMAKVNFVSRDEYKKDPSKSVTSLSRVGLNREKDKALVHLTSVCSPICGDDNYYYLIKENNKWKINKPIHFRIWN